MSILVAALEFVGDVALNKIVGKALESGSSQVWTLAKQKVPKFPTTISDRYRRLGPDQLLAFYRNEKHIVVGMDGDYFAVPSSFAIEPIGDGLVSKQTVKIELVEGTYSLPSLVDAYSAPVRLVAEKDKILFDGEVVALRSISESSDRLTVKFQRASYYDAMSTNFAMDHIPIGRSESLREFVHGPSGDLRTFEGSPLVNHVGVVFMIESTDGMLVAQRRSAKVANRPNSLSSSASGTLEWTDVSRKVTGDSLIEAVAHGAVRESVYELGLNPDTDEVFFLGALRDYERGGMADFYFFAKSEKSLAQIQASHKQAEEKDEAKSIVGFEFHSERLDPNEQSRIRFQKRVRKILETEANDQNLTFYAGTLLAAVNAMERLA